MQQIQTHQAQILALDSQNQNSSSSLQNNFNSAKTASNTPSSALQSFASYAKSEVSNAASNIATAATNPLVAAGSILSYLTGVEGQQPTRGPTPTPTPAPEDNTGGSDLPMPIWAIVVTVAGATGVVVGIATICCYKKEKACFGNTNDESAIGNSSDSVVDIRQHDQSPYDDMVNSNKY